MALRRRTKVIALAVVGLMLLGGGVAVFAWRQQASDMNDVAVVVRTVGRHYLLPTDETPALATVEDKAKLTSDFLATAENGDKLLVYKDAKKVILYRPSIDRIVQVGPVSIADTGQ